MPAAKRYALWILPFWPLGLVVAVALLHWLLATGVPQHAEQINRILPAASNLIGVLLVLWSIDSALGLLEGASLLERFMSHMKSFPRRTHQATIIAAGTASLKISPGSVSVRVRKNTDDPLEMIQELRKELDELRSDLKSQYKDLRKTISDESARASAEIQSLSTRLGQLDGKVVEYGTGGILSQLAGLLLIVYATIAGVISGGP